MQAQINDEHFMLSVKNGDLDSLIPLFEKYHLKLFNFFLRLTHCQATSEDLTQNVFSRIIQYKETFDENKSFRTWIYQIARNVNYDNLRKRKEYTTDEDKTFQLLDNPTDASKDFEKEQRHQTLMEAIDFLPQEDKEILELSRFQDLKYEEISEIIGASVGAVKVKVHRAINKLRKIYFQIA